MKDRTTTFLILFIVIVSISLSLTLGMMDYETESLMHLLTSDKGNLVTLALLSLFFSGIGIAFLFLVKFLLESLGKVRKVRRQN